MWNFLLYERPTKGPCLTSFPEESDTSTDYSVLMVKKWDIQILCVKYVGQNSWPWLSVLPGWRGHTGQKAAFGWGRQRWILLEEMAELIKTFFTRPGEVSIKILRSCDFPFFFFTFKVSSSVQHTFTFSVIEFKTLIALTIK